MATWEHLVAAVKVLMLDNGMGDTEQESATSKLQHFQQKTKLGPHRKQFDDLVKAAGWGDNDARWQRGGCGGG